MVQDQSEERTTTLLLNLIKPVEETIVLGEKFNFFDFVAWSAAIWFFITQMVVGPILRMKTNNNSKVQFQKTEVELAFDVIESARKSEVIGFTDRGEELKDILKEILTPEQLEVLKGK